jgi:hypothetical protein
MALPAVIYLDWSEVYRFDGVGDASYRYFRKHSITRYLHRHIAAQVLAGKQSFTTRFAHQQYRFYYYYGF